MFVKFFPHSFGQAPSGMGKSGNLEVQDTWMPVQIFTQ